jgi:uncharacterized protein YndB with AHSA1/START domain
VIDELRFERVIDAPPDVVFEAFATDGGQQAFYGTTTRVGPSSPTADLRRGQRLDGHVLTASRATGRHEALPGAASGLSSN